MGRDLSNLSQSPVRDRHRSSHRERDSERERERDTSPVREKRSGRNKSPRKREMSPSPPPRHRSSQRDRSPVEKERNNSSRAARSPSPRTKRLKRDQEEREAENVRDREMEKNYGKVSEKGSRREREEHGKGSDKVSRTEREGERENEKNRKKRGNGDGENGRERRSGRDEVDGKSSSSSRGRHGRSTSPSESHRRHRSKHRSQSPRERDEGTNSRRVEQRNSGEDNYDDSVAKMKATEEALEAKQKQQPSFELSGKLAAETNRVRGVTLLFNEPPDARKPDIRWRLYVFKGGEALNEPLYIHRQSCYLFGRERRVADVPTDHPSCSKQHAVIQFRQAEKEQPDGAFKKEVRPYIMDLGSTNKTFINDNPVEPQRYYELFEKDTIKFGNSSREYVLLHENSAE